MCTLELHLTVCGHRDHYKSNEPGHTSITDIDRSRNQGCNFR